MEPAALVLGPLLRYVSTGAATVWVETSRASVVEVLGVCAPTFSVEGRHYALVVIEDLAPDEIIPYEVRLDGAVVWPEPGSPFPAPVIRTLAADRMSAHLKFGSCRSVAPHELPSTLDPAEHPEGRGVDALRAVGLAMLEQDPHEWPDLIVFLGDQVYADEADVPRRHGRAGAPAGVVADFEEYCELYTRAWSPPVERWVLSVVPTAMIFDDHDVIDDWNISASWVRDIRREPWWGEHVTGALVSYWVYQHLGNLSPAAIAAEGLLAEATAAGDATSILREWAATSERFTPVPGGYQFSFDRHVGTVHLVVLDVRNGRVLEPGRRRLLDDVEWTWVCDRAREPADHLLLATSLPVFVPGGLHGLQQWNEALCDGAAGRPAAWASERLRRALDLEDWCAFDQSFRLLEELLIELATPRSGAPAPATISVLSGDIHFGYVAEVDLPTRPGDAVPQSEVRQIVCSPMRNVLRPRERRVLRFATSRAGKWLGQRLARRVDRGGTALRWSIDGPVIFQNNIGTVRFTGRRAVLTIDTAELSPDGREALRTALERPMGPPD